MYINYVRSFVTSKERIRRVQNTKNTHNIPIFTYLYTFFLSVGVLFCRPILYIIYFSYTVSLFYDFFYILPLLKSCYCVVRRPISVSILLVFIWILHLCYHYYCIIYFFGPR